MRPLAPWLAASCACCLAACRGGLDQRPPAPEIESVVLKDSLMGSGAPDASSVRSVAVAGSVVDDPVEPGTLVYLYEHRSERGYYVAASETDGAFRLEDVLVNMEDNCVQLYAEAPNFETPRETRGSLDGFYVFTLELTESSTAVRWEQLKTGVCASG